MPARRRRALPWSIVITAVAITIGCERRASVETELMLLELQAYNAELETELGRLYTELDRISAALSESVRDLESAMGDVHLRVLDLPNADLALTIREVEAAVAVANQRVREVRTAANDLAGAAEY